MKYFQYLCFNYFEVKRIHSFLSYFLISTCALFLSSCFTGVVHHHSRIKIATSPVAPDRLAINLPHFMADTSKPMIRIVGKLNQVDKKVELKESFHPKPIHKIILKKSLKKYQPKKSENLPKTKAIKDKNDFWQWGLFIVPIVGLILIITGFIFGLFGMMIPFWILWGIGLLAILFGTVLSIYLVTRRSLVAIFGPIFFILDILLIILAIVFLLIVIL